MCFVCSFLVFKEKRQNLWTRQQKRGQFLCSKALLQTRERKVKGRCGDISCRLRRDSSLERDLYPEFLKKKIVLNASPELKDQNQTADSWVLNVAFFFFFKWNPKITQREFNLIIITMCVETITNKNKLCMFWSFQFCVGIYTKVQINSFTNQISPSASQTSPFSHSERFPCEQMVKYEPDWQQTGFHSNQLLSGQNIMAALQQRTQKLNSQTKSSRD